jgi:hypothetical protein
MLVSALSMGFTLADDDWKAADLIVWRPQDMLSQMSDFASPTIRRRPGSIHAFTTSPRRQARVAQPQLDPEHLHPGFLSKLRVALALGRREAFWDVYAPTWCCAAPGMRGQASEEDFRDFHARAERFFASRDRGVNEGVWVAKPVFSSQGKGIEPIKVHGTHRGAATQLWEALWRIVGRTNVQYMLQMGVPR